LGQQKVNTRIELENAEVIVYDCDVSRSTPTEHEPKYSFTTLKSYMIMTKGGMKDFQGYYPDGSPVTGHNMWGFTDEEALLMLGIKKRLWRKWRERGFLTEKEADDVAVKLGIVPRLLWREESIEMDMVVAVQAGELD
jgi:hypothetical protein